MDWYFAVFFYFGLLCIPGVPLLLLCAGRRHPFASWSAAAALLFVALVVVGFPVAAVAPAAAAGLLLGYWSIEELA